MAYHNSFAGLSRGTSFIARLIAWIPIGAAMVMMLTAFFLVILRKLGISTLGFYEIIQISTAILVTCAWANLEVKKGHLRISVLMERFPKNIQSIIDTFTQVLSIGMSSVLAYYLFILGHNKQINGEIFSSTFPAPIAPLLYVIGFSTSIFSLVLLTDLLCRLPINKLKAKH